MSTKWSEIPGGTLNAAQQRLWTAFGDNAGAIAERLKNDEAFAYTVANYIAQYLGLSQSVTARVRKADPIDETDRQIREEFNLDPQRVANSLRQECKDLRIDEDQAMLRLSARLPIVVSRSLEEANRILKSAPAQP